MYTMTDMPSFVLLLVCGMLGYVAGHGRMIEPASRNSMWRFNYKNPRNYNDMGLNCGGFTNQFEVQGGRCGVCGDPWQGPRDHEAGGKYARGVVARQYHKGAFINVTVELTSNHMGYFEFRLCPVNDPHKKATQACLDRYLLNIAGHGSRYFITQQGGSIFTELAVMLPPNLECSQCVLQWKWVAGQSMGPDGYGGECLGCGNQENFINCADIAIGNHVVSPLPQLPEAAEATAPPPAQNGPVYETYNSARTANVDPNTVLVNQIVSTFSQQFQSQQYAAAPPTQSWNSNINSVSHHNHQHVPTPAPAPAPAQAPRWEPAPTPLQQTWQAAPPQQTWQAAPPQQIWQAPPQPQIQHNPWQSSHQTGWTESGSTYHGTPYQDYAGLEPGEYPEPGEGPSSGGHGSGQTGYMQGYNDALRRLKEQFGLNSFHGTMGSSPYNEISVHLQDHQKHRGSVPTSCPDGSELECRSSNGMSEFDSFCSNTCNMGVCPSNLCKCSCPGGSSSWSGGATGPLHCRALDPSKAGMDQWCSSNCKNNHCPPDLCVC